VEVRETERGREKEREWEEEGKRGREISGVFSFFCKDINLTGFELHPYNFKLYNYLLKGPVSKYIHIGDEGFNV
jgi:hypothetical protein